MNEAFSDMIADYREAAQLLTQMLEHGNELMREARENGEYARLRALRVRQQDLYRQRAHVTEVRFHLENYYNQRSLNCSVD